MSNPLSRAQRATNHQIANQQRRSLLRESVNSSRRIAKEIRLYIRKIVGPIPWIRNIYAAQVLEVERIVGAIQTGYCTVRREGSDRLITASFGDQHTRPPVVGKYYALYWPSKADDIGPWIEIGGNLYWYWLTGTNSSSTLWRAEWPLDSHTKVQKLWTSTSVCEFQGVDGLGNCWIQRRPPSTSPDLGRYTLQLLMIPDWGLGKPTDWVTTHPPDQYTHGYPSWTNYQEPYTEYSDHFMILGVDPSPDSSKLVGELWWHTAQTSDPFNVSKQEWRTRYIGTPTKGTAQVDWIAVYTESVGNQVQTKNVTLAQNKASQFRHRAEESYPLMRTKVLTVQADERVGFGGNGELITLGLISTPRMEPPQFFTDFDADRNPQQIVIANGEYLTGITVGSVLHNLVDLYAAPNAAFELIFTRTDANLFAAGIRDNKLVAIAWIGPERIRESSDQNGGAVYFFDGSNWRKLIQPGFIETDWWDVNMCVGHDRALENVLLQEAQIDGSSKYWMTIDGCKTWEQVRGAYLPTQAAPVAGGYLVEAGA